MLVILGGAGFWSALSGAAYGHVHTERDGRPDGISTSVPARIRTRRIAHSQVPTALGAVFAVSSLRAIVMLGADGNRI